MKVEMWRRRTLLWRKAHVQAKKVQKTLQSRSTFKMLKKCKRLRRRRSWTTFGHPDVEEAHCDVARSTFRSQGKTHCSNVVFSGRRHGFCTFPKSEQKREGRLKKSRVGRLKRICNDACRAAGTVHSRDTSIR